MVRANGPERSEYYYPAYLDLRGRACVVVGGGDVAYGKVLGLLPCGAEVTVVSPEAHPGIARFAARGKLRWERRGYRPGDVAGAFLAIAATDDRATNEAVYQEAVGCKALVNVVDVPDRCQFVAAAVFRRGRLTAAISTGGASPALASRLRRELTALWGPEYGQLTSTYRRLRGAVRARIPTVEGRKRFWLRLAADDLPLRLLRERRRAELDAYLDEALAHWPEESPEAERGGAAPPGRATAARPPAPAGGGASG